MTRVRFNYVCYILIVHHDHVLMTERNMKNVKIENRHRSLEDT